MKLQEILENQDRHFSATQVAKALRVDRFSVQRWIRKGVLNAERVGHIYSIKGEWVKDYLMEKSSTTPFRDMKTIMESYKLPFEKDEN